MAFPALSSPIAVPFPSPRLHLPFTRLRVHAAKKALDETRVEPRSVADFVERSREMVDAVGSSGPPRWFTPLDCDGRSRLKGAPTLFYFPGIDGVGLGLIRHHQRLRRIFDIWCLHIPSRDMTSFEGLLEYVEMTMQLQSAHFGKKPIYLVGECFGACLAFSLAARNPDTDFVIIAINPATSFSKSPLPSILSFSGVFPATIDALVPYFIKFTGNVKTPIPSIGQQSNGGLPENLVAIMSYLHLLVDILPRENFLWKLKMIKAASSYANSRIHSVKSQVLILASGRDPLFPNYKEAERICTLLPRCRIRFFADSGHVLLLENSVDLVSAIKGASFYRRSTHIDYVSDYLPPTTDEFEKIAEQNRWVSIATSPVLLSTLGSGKVVRGLEGIPSEGPAILVGYHMLLGLELAPMVIEFLSKKNILLRGIGHPFMFGKKGELVMPDPASFDHVKIVGACPVSAVNLYKLLSERSFVLLYPGGVREALHRKGEQYKLFWPEEPEVVRMAAQFGAKIIPFGAVGEDDVSEMLFDYDDLINIPFYKSFFDNLNDGVRNVRNYSNGEIKNQELHFPAVVPKIPGRFYYLFGKPIDTEGRKLELKNKEACRKLYMNVKWEVENCLTFLRKKRDQDSYRYLLPRLFYQLANGFRSEVPTFDL